jgi:hypothetical protein
MFNFQEALSYIECGLHVKLVLNDVNREYFMENNNIVCIPKDKEYLKYVVKKFNIDAVLSNNWQLCD